MSKNLEPLKIVKFLILALILFVIIVFCIDYIDNKDNEDDDYYLVSSNNVYYSCKVINGDYKNYVDEYENQ
jgi:formate hydrogenlyase subunit 3/multisubunit Na+/H+ antiporter MnhD subunit